MVFIRINPGKVKLTPEGSQDALSEEEIDEKVLSYLSVF